MDTEQPQKIGEYDILGVIGKGAMGKVYKAARPPQNKIVAIKLLPSEFMEDNDRVERFNREAQAIALLKHPNVVRIIERGEEDGHHYFVMEFVSGASLDAVLRQRRLSLPEAIRVFKGVCKGLAAAHQKSIVHRDLSPRNILVSEDLSVVKIADFGISRIESISQDQGTLSTTEFSLGSLHYIAPEQARNMVTADHRADIYSLGVLLYEMLTGRVPVGRFNLPSQLNSEVPPEVDPIVLKCLEVDPQNRYPTVARLLKEVARLEDQLRLGLVHEVRGIGAQTSKIFLKSGGANRGVRYAMIGAGAVGLIGLGFLAVRTLRAPEPETNTGAEPVEVVRHERPDISEPEVDPLTEALENSVTPQEEEDEDTSGDKEPSQNVDPGGEDNSKSLKAAAPRSSDTPNPVAARQQISAQIAEDIEVARKKLDAGLHAEALQDVQDLIARYPDAAITPKAYLLLGKIHERSKAPDKARATYIELQGRFGKSDEAAEGIYRSAELLETEGGRERLREARTLLGELAERYPSSRWAPRALLKKAAIETEARWTARDPVFEVQVSASLPTYRDFVTKFPAHPGAEEALWNLGEMYEELKEFDLAVEAFEKLGSQFPATKHDAWWSAGQVYDRRLDDDERAVDAYRKVPTQSRHHGDAQRRINKLTK